MTAAVSCAVSPPRGALARECQRRLRLPVEAAYRRGNLFEKRRKAGQRTRIGYASLHLLRPRRTAETDWAPGRKGLVTAALIFVSCVGAMWLYDEVHNY